MFDDVTKPDADGPRRGAVLRRGVAVVLVLAGAFSLISGVTVIGFTDLIGGILIGAFELRGVLRG